uniref:Uncharacterized protein n=1 Tax=Arion vulgaris TaxID=1028688 RepID=A0A0B7BUS8_9EUPU
MSYRHTIIEHIFHENLARECTAKMKDMRLPIHESEEIRIALYPGDRPKCSALQTGN